MRKDPTLRITENLPLFDVYRNHSPKYRLLPYVTQSIWPVYLILPIFIVPYLQINLIIPAIIVYIVASMGIRFLRENQDVKQSNYGKMDWNPKSPFIFDKQDIEELNKELILDLWTTGLKAQDIARISIIYRYQSQRAIRRITTMVSAVVAAIFIYITTQQGTLFFTETGLIYHLIIFVVWQEIIDANKTTSKISELSEKVLEFLKNSVFEPNLIKTIKSTGQILSGLFIILFLLFILIFLYEHFPAIPLTMIIVYCIYCFYSIYSFYLYKNRMHIWRKHARTALQNLREINTLAELYYYKELVGDPDWFRGKEDYLRDQCPVESKFYEQFRK